MRTFIIDLVWFVLGWFLGRDYVLVLPREWEEDVRILGQFHGGYGGWYSKITVQPGLPLWKTIEVIVHEWVHALQHKYKVETFNLVEEMALSVLGLEQVNKIMFKVQELYPVEAWSVEYHAWYMTGVIRKLLLGEALVK